MNSLKTNHLFLQYKTLNLCKSIISIIYFCVFICTNSCFLFGQAVGPEFQVNTQTINDQHMADIAMRSDGDFVVVWAGARVLANAISDLDIFGRMYNADGTVKGPEIIIHTDSTASHNPAIAMDSSGNFVVVWESELGTRLDDYLNILAQRYDSNGNKIGSLFQINTTIIGFQRKPDIAMDAQGNFVVVWESIDNSDEHDIYGQRFSSTGSKIGKEFIINEGTALKQRSPDVAMDQNGNFIAVWDSEIGSNAQIDVLGRQFNVNSAVSSSEFTINSLSSDDKFFPDVTITTSGNFLVAWTNIDQHDEYSISAQLFQSDLSKIGAPIRVDNANPINTFASGPVTAADPKGNFVISWNDDSDGDLLGVSAQCFQTNGFKIGEQIRVNTEFNDLQFDPEIALDTLGNFTIVWTSQNQETSVDQFFMRNGVFGQRFESKFQNDCSIDPLVLSGSPEGDSNYHTISSITSEQILLSKTNTSYLSNQNIVLNEGFQINQNAALQMMIGNCMN